MGFFYVEAKSFDIRSEFRVGDGIRIAERCRGLFRAMFLSRLSVGWLRRSMEELWQGGEVREFYRTFQGGEGGGSTVHILQRRGNNHGRFFELSKYGNGGRQTFVIISEGSEGSGWANCHAQLRRLKKFYVKTNDGGRKVGRYKKPIRW